MDRTTKNVFPDSHPQFCFSDFPPNSARTMNIVNLKKSLHNNNFKKKHGKNEPRKPKFFEGIGPGLVRKTMEVKVSIKGPFMTQDVR